MKTLAVVALTLAGVITICQPGSAQEAFSWERGWYTDGTNDWFLVRDVDRVLMSTATLQPDSSMKGLVFELDLSDASAARSRPYGSNAAWTGFELTFDGTDTFLIDGTPFTRLDVDPGEDFDVEADTPSDQYGLMFLVYSMESRGESVP